MATSTMFTYLLHSTSSSGYTKLCPIKDYPDLGGAPEQVETTTLDDKQATYVDGVQQLERIEFTANYDATIYNTIKNSTSGYFKLCFCSKEPTGETITGDLGEFSWEGQLSVWVVGGGVNGVREMRISITPATEITHSIPESTSVDSY